MYSCEFPSNGRETPGTNVTAVAMPTPRSTHDDSYAHDHCSLRRTASCARFTLSLPLLFVVCWIVTIAYQIGIGAYQDDFYYEDTAPHFVTGVMVADYLRTSPGSNPIAYAEQYYLRSPKVAFGRWPPLFHILQGVVYLVFGASKATALVLVAAIAAMSCACLCSRISQLYGFHVATLALAVYVGFAIVRWHALLVMSDLLTTLFCAVATFELIDFLLTRRSRHLALGMVWTVLALLTKETAIHLLLLAPVAFVIVDRGKVVRDWRYGILVTVILTLGGGLLLIRLFSGLGVHGYHDLNDLLRRMTQVKDYGAVISAFLEIAPGFVLFLAACGVVASECRRVCDETTVHVRICVAWIGVVVIFFLVSPAPPGGRYFMPALIPLTMLVAHLFYALRDSFMNRSRLAGRLIPTTVAAAAILTSPQANEGGVRGYLPLAKAIPVEADTVSLISSNAFGEGAFVSDRLLVDRKQLGVVLRGSKVLATSDWHGTDYRLLRNNASDIHAFLRDTPVHYIVLDLHRFSNTQLSADRELLRRALEEHPQEFRTIGRFPVLRGSTTYEDAVVVYENLGTKGRRAESLSLQLNNGLGQTLKLERHSPATIRP